MRLMRFAGVVLPIVLLMMSIPAVSQQNEFGVSDYYHVNFTDPVRVAGTLLPKGDYEIRHTMDGQDHVMVFRQLGTINPVVVKAKCKIVPLPEKAVDTRKTYRLNDANERVLQEMTFKGDMAKHVF